MKIKFFILFLFFIITSCHHSNNNHYQYRSYWHYGQHSNNLYPYRQNTIYYPEGHYPER